MYEIMKINRFYINSASQMFQKTLGELIPDVD